MAGSPRPFQYPPHKHFDYIRAKEEEPETSSTGSARSESSGTASASDNSSRDNASGIILASGIISEVLALVNSVDKRLLDSTEEHQTKAKDARTIIEQQQNTIDGMQRDLKLLQQRCDRYEVDLDKASETANGIKAYWNGFLIEGHKDWWH